MSINNLSWIISANHIFQFVFFAALSVLMYRESKRRNGFTKAVFFVFAALAINSLWSMIYLFGWWATQWVSYAHRAGSSVILTASLVWLMIKFWKEAK